MSAAENLSSKTLRGFTWSSASLVIQAILQVVVISLLARLLSPREFGVLGVALIFTNFAERVGFLGIGPALIQREEIDEGIERLAWTLSVVLGLCAYVLLFFSAPAIARFFDDAQLVGVVRVLSCLLILESAGSVPESLLQRDLQFKKLLFVTNTAYMLGNGLVAIALALLGFGVWSLVLAVLAGRTIKTVWLMCLRPQRPSVQFSIAEARSLLRTGIGFSLGRLLSFFALNGDNFIVGRVLGTVALGMYGRAYQLMTLPATYFGQALEKVLFPAMAKKQSSPERLASVYLWGLEASSLVGLCGSVFMFIAAQEIILVLFGARWLEVVPALQLLSLGMGFRLCYKNSDTVIRSLGAVYRHAARQALYAGIVVAGSYYGCRWGIEGVAVAVLAALVVNYLALSELGMRLLSISWRRFLLAHAGGAWCAAWTGIAAAVYFQIARSADVPALVSLAGGIAVSAAVCVVAIRFMPAPIRPEMFSWAVATFRFEKFGAPGRMMNRILVSAE